MGETTTDHDTIRRWAERKGGKPVAVETTHQGDDVGIVRIMLPDRPQSEHESLIEISWDEYLPPVRRKPAGAALRSRQHVQQDRRARYGQAA